MAEQPEMSAWVSLWQQWGLHLTDKGIPHLNLHNAALIVESDPRYKGHVYYDAFLQRVMRRNSPEREWSDADDLELTRHIQSELGLPRIGVDAVAKAVQSVAFKHTRNCVTEWFDTLKHDGTPRIDKFFPDCFGAEDSDYTQAASRNFWLSLVARPYKPGCKVDNMIILEGAQGVGKSTALQIIGDRWFAEQHESATNPKAFSEILQGKLLIEVSEMDAFSKAEVNRVKQTVSCPSDRFRASYGRHAVDHPRTCVFVGTTNRDDWNRDETGARRFWPIHCTDINLEAIEANRDQLFAEAIMRHKAGEPHWLMPEAQTKAEQAARFQEDPWQERIGEIIKGEARVTTAHVAEKLGIGLERRDRATEMRIAASLRHLGWKRKRARGEGGERAYFYVRCEDGEDSRDINPFPDH